MNQLVSLEGELGPVVSELVWDQVTGKWVSHCMNEWSSEPVWASEWVSQPFSGGASEWARQYIVNWWGS